MGDERETYRGLVEDLKAKHNEPTCDPWVVSIYARAAEAITYLCGVIERLRMEDRKSAVLTAAARTVGSPDDLRAEFARLSARVAEMEARADREDTYRAEQNERGG